MPWQPEFLMESNSVNNFWRGPPKEHCCQVWSKLALQFGRRRCLKKLLTTYDGHITTLKAPLEHVVLRWAKNYFKTDIKGISGQLECAKILYRYRFLFISLQQTLFHVALEALGVNYLNPFPNKPGFLRVCSTSLLKTLWEKEKLLVTSNFSFSHSVFYPFEELFSIFVKFEIIVCKLFHFWKSLKFVVWKRV